MTKEKKFTSKDMLARMRMVPPLAYEFNAHQVTDGVRRFLKYVGYRVEPGPPGLTPSPDFYARRQEGEATYVIAGVVTTQLEKVTESLNRLGRVKETLGEEADYVLALPPVSEFHLINFLGDEGGKQYAEIKRNRVMLWLCNPDEESVWCLIGQARDRRFYDYFKFGKMNIPQFFGARFGPRSPEEDR